MKAFSLSLLAFFLFTTAGFAQYQEVKATGKAVIKTPTILCEKCQERVEFFLTKSTPGVTSVAVNIRKKTTTVTWLNDRTTLLGKDVLVKVTGTVKLGKANVFKTFPVSYEGVQRFSTF